MDERLYWLGFSVFPGIGPGKFKLLLEKFGSAKEAWETSHPDLKNIIGEKLALDFEEFRKTFSIEKYLEKLEKEKVWFLTREDLQYPSLLLQTDKPPIVLFGKGHPEFISELVLNSIQESGSPIKSGMTEKIPKPASPASTRGVQRGEQVRDDREVRTIAVVGTRKITNYGREVTEILTAELVQSGFTIVSGLALGVDAIAHKTAIENNGKTIAVLGCGVDLCYPSSNKRLYDEIINGNGAIISEFPLGMTPNVGSFPSRNRIIAGLSQGVLVTEGAEDSGSLITADYAIKYQRKVFAVPGPITSGLSKGPNSLISKGAKLVVSSNDILKELDSRFSPKGTSFSEAAHGDNTGRSITDNTSIMKKNIKGSNEEEMKILKVLQNESKHFDEIVRKTGFESSTLGGLLTIMEIKGMIKSLESGMYSIVLSS